ncbi:MAG: Bug family tripartite tricarboxylate transporter substrate binding protein [Burkholderiales bacterium]
MITQSKISHLPNVLSAALVSFGAMALLLPNSTNAQTFPVKPVRVIVPFAPGGASDGLARIVGDKLGRALGQSFVIENRAGVGGMLGSDLVAKAPPDGYMLVISGIASHVVAPAMGSAPFDPMKSFSHIALIGGPPSGLMVHPGVPARNIAELVAYSKSLPNGLSYGSAGHATHSHMMSELFRVRTGANMVHIPYKGAGPAVADVVAGHLAATFTGTVAVAQVRAGRTRMLAVTSEKRMSEVPDVPTFAEVGLRELTTATWFGLSGPAAMPRDIVVRLNSEVRNAMNLPDVREKLGPDGIEPNNLDADAYTAFVRAEIEKWGPVARTLGPEKTKP